MIAGRVDAILPPEAEVRGDVEGRLAFFENYERGFMALNIASGDGVFSLPSFASSSCFRYASRWTPQKVLTGTPFVHKWEPVFQGTANLFILRYFLWVLSKDCHHRKQVESGVNTTSGSPSAYPSGFLGLPPSRPPSPSVPKSGTSPLSMANDFRRLKGQYRHPSAASL